MDPYDGNGIIDDVVGHGMPHGYIGIGGAGDGGGQDDDSKRPQNIFDQSIEDLGKDAETLEHYAKKYHENMEMLWMFGPALTTLGTGINILGFEAIVAEPETIIVPVMGAVLMTGGVAITGLGLVTTFTWGDNLKSDDPYYWNHIKDWLGKDDNSGENSDGSGEIN